MGAGQTLLPAWWTDWAWWMAAKIAPFILLYPVLRYMVTRGRSRPSVQLAGWKRFVAVLLAAVYGFFAARLLFELFRWAHAG
jgi:NADH:ubiquinone oxidoreductase subunit H